MGSTMRRVLQGAVGLGVATGLASAGALVAELINPSDRLWSTDAYDTSVELHGGAWLGVVAVLPLIALQRWGSTTPDATAPQERGRMIAGLSVAVTPLLLWLEPTAFTAGLGVAVALCGALVLHGASAVRDRSCRAALRWAGGMVTCAGVLTLAAALATGPWSPWVSRSHAWATRAVLAGLPLATVVRERALSRASAGWLGAALVVFTVASGPLQPLRALAAALALKIWRTSLARDKRDARRTWLLGAAGLWVVGECAAAVIGLDNPLTAFTYVPVAQRHYVAAAGLAAAVATGAPSSADGHIAPGRRWAVVYLLGAHLGCGALMLLGRSGVPRRFATYDPSLQVWFELAAVGAAMAWVAAAAVAWSKLRNADPREHPPA